MSAIATIEAEPVALALPDDIHKLLAYDPASGMLVWKHRPISLFRDGYRTADAEARSWNRRYSGQPAFTSVNNHGYRHGTIFGKSYQAHRVIWAIVHGHWPLGEIDHINGDRTDNRLVNLRDVPPAENRKNQTRSVKNTSGATGVHWCNTWSRWVAKIMVDRKTKVIGTFKSFEEAKAAREAASKKMGFADGHGKEARQ